MNHRQSQVPTTVSISSTARQLTTGQERIPDSIPQFASAHELYVYGYILYIQYIDLRTWVSAPSPWPDVVVLPCHEAQDATKTQNAQRIPGHSVGTRYDSVNVGISWNPPAVNLMSTELEMFQGVGMIEMFAMFSS